MPEITGISNTPSLTEMPFEKVTGAILTGEQFKFVLLLGSLLQLLCTGSVLYHWNMD